MSLKGNYTAEIVAYARARGSLYKDPAIRNADYLSRQFLNLPLTIALYPGLRSLLQMAYDWMTPGIRLYLHMRTRVIDSWFESEVQSGAEQVAIVGAGYDSRAYRYRERLQGVRVFECDHPITASRKRQRLARWGGDVTHVTFVNVDLVKESLEARLSEAGFNPDARSIILCEGLFYYLPIAIVESIFKFVSELPAGSSIIFDYVLHEALAFPESHYGMKELLQYLERKKEPIRSSLSHDKMPVFLKSYGLEVVSNVRAVSLTNDFLRRSDGRVLGEICGAYGIAKARRS
jgi:methyltransferase (TIGR00027 family)